jgi:hypothetical protein
MFGILVAMEEVKEKIYRKKKDRESLPKASLS